MGRFTYRFLLFSLAFLLNLSGGSCDAPAPDPSSIPPTPVVPTPNVRPSGNANAGANTNTNISPVPTPSPQAAAAGSGICKNLNEAGDRQICAYSLPGYKEAEYYHFNSQALESFVNSVANYIEAAQAAEGCRLVSVTIWGYADSQTLVKKLPWAEVPQYCQTECRKNSATTEDLTNDDLACVRQCLVVNRIKSLLQQDTQIDNNTSLKWQPNHSPFSKPSEVGGAYRRVDINVERGGRCLYGNESR